MSGLLWSAPLLGVVGLVVAAAIYFTIKARPAGTEKMVEIADAIHDGAMAFLKREYKVLAVFIVVVFCLMLTAESLGWRTGVAFLGGALCSIFAGLFGMQAATKANVRTSEAARSQGIAAALFVSYSGGAVMGLAVASLGLLGVGIAFLVWGNPQSAQYINGFAMGASSIALFARVGGGIFTKAADVGSDLVGKIEAGIPEDDPRNPGVIADNVGDNVGDIAGMGADIFESYVGSIVAAIAIAATASASSLAALGGNQVNLMFLPIFLAVIGLLSSLVGVFSMNILKNSAPAAALRNSTFIGAGLFLVGAWFAVSALGISSGAFWAVLLGTVAGIC